MENTRVPSGQPGVSPYLCGVGVARCGQLFYSRGQLLAPVVLGRGFPDVLLWFTQGRRWIDRYGFTVAAEQRVAAINIAGKQNASLFRSLPAHNAPEKANTCTV